MATRFHPLIAATHTVRFIERRILLRRLWIRVAIDFDPSSYLWSRPLVFPRTATVLSRWVEVFSRIILSASSRVAATGMLSKPFTARKISVAKSTLSPKTSVYGQISIEAQADTGFTMGA